MSSVAFHSLDSGTVRVGGAERAWAGVLCTRMMEDILDLDCYPAINEAPLSTLIRMLRPGHYVHDFIRKGDAHQVARALQITMNVELDGHVLEWNRQPVEVFALAINTALALGNDAVRFLARMHGACEIHAWIDGRNRWWIANIIEDGLASGVMRTARQTQYENWPGVIAMLRNSSQSPVVMSYSVTNSFPNFELVSGHDFEKTPWNKMTEAEQLAMAERREAFADLPAHEQWAQAFRALELVRGRELRQDNWKTFRYVHKLSALDLMADDWESRLDRAFPPDEQAA